MSVGLIDKQYVIVYQIKIKDNQWAMRNPASKGLVTNYGEGGGLQNGRWWGGGGHMKFYPYELRGGGGENFSHAEGWGGGKQVLRCFFLW